MAQALSWGASITVHVGIVLGIGWLAYHSLRARPAENPEETPALAPLAVELPIVSEGTLTADEVLEKEGTVPHPSGGATVPRIDDGRLGHGGTGRVPSPATHLSDRDERLSLTPDLISHLDRDQQQRLRTASDRASWEDRRATTHPMELTFLASGTGDRAERRAPTPSDPSLGARAAHMAEVAGAHLGAAEHEPGPDLVRMPVGASREGSHASSPGIGVDDGRVGPDHRASANVARGRPDVTLGPVTIPATEHSRERDDVDSDQSVAAAVRSIVHASTAGGMAGEGNGGTSGGGAPGAGAATGIGSHAMPLGTGEGDYFDLNSRDPRVMPYFRRLHAKLHPLWANAFPRSALLELKQGLVILEFTIERDGSARVSWPPLRPSGIDEFDRNCADAIRKASPFEPIPKELGRTRLRIRAPFEAQNPIVK
ncbi:energy transducer TonB [Pendulispora albinea]|uniref:Energy transducer TonB n=1 Tax=Pendulispora albinea TaxID=2741071 RepID=A0ABZ2LNT9_9BACT